MEPRQAEPSLGRRLDSPWVVCAVVAVAYLLFVGARLESFHNDVSRLVTAGDYFCDPRRVPPGLTVIPRSQGYDGQYFYRLALNPFTARQTDFGIRLDNPPYRQQRILYPLLVWALSLSHRTWVPRLMLLVNFLGLCWLGWMAGRYAQSLQRHALWGVALPFYPGLLFAISLDTCEVVAAVFLLSALWQLRQGRSGIATLSLMAAVLTRETAILAAVGALLTWLWETGRRKPVRSVPWHLFAVPLLSCLVWQVVLQHQWGRLPDLATRSGNVGLPLLGIVHQVWAMRHDSLKHIMNMGLAGSFLIGFTVCVLLTFRQSAAGDFAKLSWILFLLLASTLTGFVLLADYNFLRALSEFFLFGMAILIQSRSRATVLVTVGTLAYWLFLAVTVLKFRPLNFPL